jgi:acetyltransferase-like isoleucine patch superfamily enzyme
MGVNATLANNVTIGEDNWIGLGVTIVKGTEANQLFKGERSEPAKISATDFFKVRE